MKEDEINGASVTRVHKILIGQPEKNTPLERQRHRLEDNMKLDQK